MASQPLGKLEILSLSDLWKHEERDFTPWLAQNIEKLSSVLGVPIVVDQTEHKVGGYELDILGHVEENDTVVIIENQLYATDHGHLGQLITYAAGLEAAIVIWISPDVRDEHRTAIEWLNSHMDDKVSFFLVRPEVFRIDNSNPAVRFEVECGPSEFGRRLKNIVEKENSPRHDFRRKFWEALFQFLASDGHSWAKGRSTTKESWIDSTVGKGGIGVNVSMAQGSRMRVEIYLAKNTAKERYDKLFLNKEKIEAAFPDEAISWERLEDAEASRVAVYRPYDKAQSTENTLHRQELYSWISKNVKLFRQIAKQYLVDN